MIYINIRNRVSILTTAILLLEMSIATSLNNIRAEKIEESTHLELLQDPIITGFIDVTTKHWSHDQKYESC